MPLTRITSQLISIPSNYPLTGSLSGTASYATTASFAMNGGSGGGGGAVQTGSIANQTILYNVTTSQDNVISGLNLTGNKWGVTVVEEWNSGSIVGDQYYNSCSLLLHFSGSNGSTTFVDNSPVTKSVTSNNGASISTAQSKFGGSSGFFDGTNDYLTSTVINGLGSGNFTLEFFYYKNTNSGYLFNSRTFGTGDDGIDISHDLTTTTSAQVLFNSVSILTNQWTHVAFVRSGSTITRYINGSSNGTTTNTNNFSGTAFYIGGSISGNTGYLNGYIDEFRLTTGIARYTSSFTTQSAEFPNNIDLTQLQTKYIGLVGGLNDSSVDYGVEKLSDSSLKIRKMTASGQPLSGSGSTLSASVDRVYVNVLDYTNVMVTSSNALTASYAQTLQNTNWTVSSFVTNDTTQSIAAFDNSGLPMLVKPTSDNVYLVVQNGIMKWIPIASVAVSILNSTFSENESVIDGLYQTTITSVAFVSSFTSGSI
jgi:hypothetical protein